MPRIVELLVIPGCPNTPWARAAVRSALNETELDGSVEVREIEVVSDEQARRLRFAGSPTVRVDGEDVERGAESRAAAALQCRIYMVDGELHGAPPVSWIRDALRR